MNSLFLEQVSEQQRLAVLDSFNILDTAPEVGFDDIVMLARQICDTPIALVSLVASDRQWFKAVSGLDACETPLNQSVCRHALNQATTMIIPDLTLDERTKANTLVTAGPLIRFYAGALLTTTSGVAIGTLCVIDTEPRPAGLTESQVAALEALARQVMAQLELRRAMAVGESAFADQRYESEGFEARAIESERLNARLIINEARLRMAQEAGKIGTFEIDVPSDQIAATEEFCRIFGVPYRPMFRFSELERMFYPADRALVSNTERRRKGDLAAHAEFRILHGGTGAVTWISRRAQVVRDASGNAQRIIGTVQDITERREIEERQRVLNEELSHRMKNTMSLVQAIAQQTLRNAVDRSAVHTFGQRINALSRAHDVLLRQSWVAADLHDVMLGVIGLHGDVNRFSLAGPPINLGPKAALSLALLLHELATNAVKYGALSVPEGHVAIVWSSVEPDLVLKWTETGGPPVKVPGKPGLGSRLIDMGFAGTGVVDKRYDSSGFSAEFRAPLQLVQEH